MLGQAFAFTWTSLALIFLSFLSLFITFLYRRRADRKAREGRYPKKRGGMMAGILGRGKRDSGYDPSGKRDSYGSSYYSHPNQYNDKEIDAGGRTSTARPAGAGYGDTGNPSVQEGRRRYGRGPEAYELARGGAVGSLADAQRDQNTTRMGDPVRAEDIHLNAARSPPPPAVALKNAEEGRRVDVGEGRDLGVKY